MRRALLTASTTAWRQSSSTQVRLLSTSPSWHSYRNYQESRNGGGWKIGAGVAAVAIGTGVLMAADRRKLAAKEDILRTAGSRQSGLPEYRKEQVSSHDEEKKRIWVTFKNGVYDITDLVPKHPGAKNILMAAGGSLEPFWNLYAVHWKNKHVYEWLEQYRIGNLHPDDVKENEELAKTSDPYLMEPKNRNPGLIVNSAKPFNAETPLKILAENFYTPNEWFYVRNHLPTPDVTSAEYSLDVEAASGKEVNLSLKDLKTKFKKTEVTAAIQCGGNRRAEMNEIKAIKGLMWKGGAIGNAKWAGAKLSDVLKGYDLKGVKHVQFEGYDEGSDGSPYGASIPIQKAMAGDVILAYEMNGEVLPRDHGFPIRVVAPGIVGARNVKWLKRIILSHEESHSHWQRSDYKGFNPSVSWDNVDFSKSPAIQNMPVTSVICQSNVKGGKVHLKGYAWAGGGNRIIRVDLTADKGETWHEAVLEKQEKDDVEPEHFGWTLWKAEIPLKKGQKGQVEIWSKAVDSNYNSQPESFKNIWNLRGLNSNAYHRVKVSA